MLDAALALSPADLDVRRTQIWIDLYERQYQGAAAGMRGLAEAIPAQPKDDAALTSARQAATFLGRMHGFLSGPAEGQIPPARVKAVDAIARKRLSGELLSAYEAGDAAVKAQFKKLAAEKPSKPKPPANNSDAATPTAASDAAEPEKDEATKVQRSLTTYEKFPLEAERRRLLKQFE
jgi:hypothetical protein